MIDDLIRTNNLLTNNDLNQSPRRVIEMCLEHFEREIEEELERLDRGSTNNSED